MARCRVCDGDIAAFMSFGRMPIANGFLTAAEVADEYVYELAPAVCSQCGMFQLIEQPAPDRMFHTQYAFYSATSRHMQRHFERFAQSVLSGPLKGRTDPFVVEIGSNDGSMLRHFAAAGIRHLGIEPSANVAEAAREAGVETLAAFFDEALAGQVADTHGRADVVLAANAL